MTAGELTRLATSDHSAGMEELGAGSGRSRLATPPPPSAPTLPPPPPPPPGAAPPSLSREPSFHGSGGTLLGIHVVNVLLIIVTLACITSGRRRACGATFS